MLFLAEEEAVFVRVYHQHEVKRGERRTAYKKRFCKSRSMSSSKSLSNSSASISSSLVVSSEEEDGVGFGPYWTAYCLLQNR